MNFDELYNSSTREDLIKKIEHKINTLTLAELESLYYQLTTTTQASER